MEFIYACMWNKKDTWKKYTLEKYNIHNKTERESFVSVGNQHQFMYIDRKISYGTPLALWFAKQHKKF